MKLQKVFLVLAILFSLQICFAQEKPKAEIIDQIQRTNCEEFLARLNSFFGAIGNNPNSTAYAIIYSDKNLPRRITGYEKFIARGVYYRKLDKSRIKVIHAEKKDKFEVEFWIVPPGAEKPQFIGIPSNEKIPDLTKSFIFDSFADDGVCPTFVPEFYADFIKANPNVRGNIVIFDSSKINRQEKAKELLTTFTKDFKVPRNRLRVFFAKDKNSPYVEFWVVPITK